MNQTPETDFQNAFAQMAQFKKCTLETIPDYIPVPDGYNINGKRKYKKFQAKKRPFDAVLVTPKNVYCLEFKYQNGIALPHQKNTGNRITNINKTAYFIVRKKVLKSGTTYSIEDNVKRTRFKTTYMEKLVEAFL